MPEGVDQGGPERASDALEFTPAEREVLAFLRNSKRVDLRWLSEQEKTKIRAALDGLHNGKKVSLLHLKGGWKVVHGDMGTLPVTGNTHAERRGSEWGVGGVEVQTQENSVQRDVRGTAIFPWLPSWRPYRLAGQRNLSDGHFDHNSPSIRKIVPRPLRKLRPRVSISYARRRRLQVEGSG